MATNAISSYYNGYGNYDLQRQKVDGQSPGNSDSEKAHKSLKDMVREKVSALLDGIPKSGNKLTFDDVTAYRDKLRDEFEAKAKEDLEKMGVDTERKFTLSYDANSDKVTVDNNHPDKEKIDKYFAANDEMREKFARIVSLSNLTRAAETKFTPAQFRSQLQISSMKIWTENNLTGAELSGTGNMLFGGGSGAASFFGLDMKV